MLSFGLSFVPSSAVCNGCFVHRVKRRNAEREEGEEETKDHENHVHP